jgi:hypothetical protein
VPITWKKASDYHLESGCGRYTVSKTMGTDGKTPRYTAWLAGDGRHRLAECLGQFTTGKEARQCAESHATPSSQSAPS